MSEICEDKEVAVASKEIEPIYKKALALQVIDERTSKLATDFKDYAKKLWKHLEERRKFFVGPLNDHIKKINAEFATIMSPLEVVEKDMKTKLMSYLEEVRRTQTAKAMDRQKELDNTAKKLGIAPVKVEVEEKRTISGALGTSFTRKDWTWEVEDISKVPDEYFILDEKKISGLVRAHIKVSKGVSSNNLVIPGIKVFQKETVI